MAIHYFLVIAIIAIIILIQFYVYVNTGIKIKSFKSIFPISITSYSVSQISVPISNDESEDGDAEIDDEGVLVSQISIQSSNEILIEIKKSLNMYLLKNKGAASDFYLMKDVVERYCDSEEEEISIQQPIPLYLGLMGTMIGIIVGVGFIAFNGGLTNASLMDSITSLMSSVAIAMLASLVGIYCTTRLSWKAKNASSTVQANKNRFYSWLQTELLPVLTGNTTNALYLLQQNLMTFNTTFQNNISGLDSALSRITDTSQEQMELISLIKDIDVKKVAQANVSVLRELKGCINEISVFNSYLHSVGNYLTAVNNLSSNLNEHLTRTATIEKMGAFFEKEINQVETRERYINEVVANVDNTLKKSFEQLSESSQKSIAELKNSSIEEFNSLQKHYGEQKEEFNNMMAKRKEDISQMMLEQDNKISKHYKVFEELLNEIKKMADVKDAMKQLLELSQEQSLILQKMSDTLCCHNNQIESPSANISDDIAEVRIEKLHIPNSVVYLLSGIMTLLLFVFGLYVYNSFFVSNKSEVSFVIPNQFIEKEITPTVTSDTMVVDSVR